MMAATVAILRTQSVLLLMNEWLDWVGIFIMGTSSKDTWYHLRAFDLTYFSCSQRSKFNTNYKVRMFYNCWDYWPGTFYIVYPLCHITYHTNIRSDIFLGLAPGDQNRKHKMCHNSQTNGWIASTFLAYYYIHLVRILPDFFIWPNFQCHRGPSPQYKIWILPP
jgi:hypothetical protein